MSDHPWLSPHLGAGSTVVVIVLATAFVLVFPILGRRGYRRLVATRAAGVPGVLERRYRKALTRQAAASVVVLAVVLFDGGVSHADVGLVLPTGRRAGFMWAYAVLLSALVLVVGLLLRRRALRGGSIPGQSVVAALLPGTARERRFAAAIAVGAGVTEELVFRGLFTAAAVDLLGLHAAPAAALVCVAFGFAHLYQGWRGMLGTAVIGGALSWFYLQTQSLLLPMLLHVVIDLRGLVIIPLSAAAGTPTGGRRGSEHGAPAARVRQAPASGTAAPRQDDVHSERVSVVEDGPPQLP